MRIGSIILALTGSGARAAPAHAGEPCAGVRVHGAFDLAPAWSDAVAQLSEQFPPLADASCASVTLAIEPAPGGGTRLLAMTADGRYAERTVQRPVALVATALGLVASIPGEPIDTVASPGAAPASGATSAPMSSAAAPPHPPAPATAPVPFEVWLGVGAGVRIGSPSGYEMLDFEARADAILRGWLLTLAVRYSPSVGPDTSDFVFDEAVFGLGIGRRLPVGRGAFDLSVVPALATMNLRWDQDESDPQSGSITTFRLGVSARWSTPVNRTWHFTVTADGDVAPAGLEHPWNLGADEPSFPVWTAGVRLGASGALW